MMKKKFTKAVSLILAMMTSITTVSTVFTSITPIVAEENTVINENTTWNYLDSGSDPSSDASDRTSWTTSNLTDWNTGTGSFGALKGETPTEGTIPNVLMNQYTDETKEKDIASYFFRTNVNVTDKSSVKSITGEVVYSESAAVTVYLNGHKIAGFNDSSITSNTQYVNEACRGAGPGPMPKGPNEESNKASTITTTTSSISVWENVEQYLNDGENIVAVEVHQSCPTNDAIYFAMPSLNFSTESKSQTIDNISLSIGSDETQRNFTWYSNYNDGGKLLIAKQSDLVDGNMPTTATAYEPKVTSATNKTGYYSCQTTATNLESNTTYAYQIVSGDTKTEIKTFKTGTGSAFSFAFAGDPQIGASRNAESDGKGWEATLNLIANNEQLSDVEFMLSAGDQVEQATSEEQYGYYLNHNTLYDLPVATNVGNHDTSSVAYDEHFNVPNESAYGKTAASGDYYFVYNHVLFMALNSNNTSTAEHKAFMEQAIEATKDQNITWKIVTFHHSIYSVANHASDKDIIQRRTQLSPVFKELDIDVVLMGHDHVYCRTYMMDGETPMTDASIYDDENYSSITNPEGILYVTANSASGSKFYNIQKDTSFEYAKVLNQEQVPNISRVSISDNQFTITTYRTTDMSVVDTFTINHKKSYSITVDAVENGSASADVTSSISGNQITLTATANEGYQFKGWEVVTGNITIENQSFVMAEEDVEVKPIFEKIEDSKKEEKKDDSSTDKKEQKKDDSSTKKQEETSQKQSKQVNTSDTSNVLGLSLMFGIPCVGIAIFTILRKKKA